MRKEKDRKNVTLLVRDGVGTKEKTLRIKSSVPISEQRNTLVKISLSNSDYKIPKEIGPLAELLVRSVKNTIPSVQMISFRRSQVIFDLGIGNVWTEEKERAVKNLVDSLLTKKGFITQWRVERKAPWPFAFVWPGEKEPDSGSFGEPWPGKNFKEEH
ncbi:hypothetical protein KJ841_00220 [Patescibacteria group bacterium]|nr:hypothetical protein [Patescibacteria group bacterium]